MTHAHVIDLDELANDLTVTSLSRWNNGNWMELDSGNDPPFIVASCSNSQGTVVNYFIFARFMVFNYIYLNWIPTVIVN
jgi:hypothetical protein